jgi:hypothetical protein
MSRSLVFDRTATASVDRALFPRPTQPTSGQSRTQENKLFGYRKRTVVITYSDADIVLSGVDILSTIQCQHSTDVS